MVYLIIIILICTTEIFVKDYIERHHAYCKETKFWNGRISVTKQYNRGGCMNLLEKKAEIIRWSSTIMLIGVIIRFLWELPKKGGHGLKLALSFIIGGSLSNIGDRLVKGRVVDYLIINVKKLKDVVFNIGDIFIFLGAFLLMLRTFFGKEK